MSVLQIRSHSGNCRAEILLPASKSISNRLLMIKALCHEDFTIENLSNSDDTQVLQSCIDNLQKNDCFDVNDAGTAFRFLTALFAITPGIRVLTGSARMRRRPVSDLVKALKNLGADIVFTGARYHPPLIINGTQIINRKVSVSAGISSQFVSALLLIAPKLPQGINLMPKGHIASKPYIDMTLQLMSQFGIQYKWVRSRIIIENQAYQPMNFTVESDWSAAAFWYQIVALSRNAEVELLGLTQHSLQGDAAVAEMFDKMGVKTSYLANSVLLTKKETTGVALTYDFFQTPDLFPAAVATCAGLNIPFHFTGLQNLVIKESDRVLAMITELAKFGFYFNYDGQESSMVYDGNKGNYPEADVMVDAHNDHRIAMSLSPLALRNCSIRLSGSECVSKSYPDYFNHLRKAGFSVL